MASFYEAATSGRNLDRFAMDDLISENTIVRMKQHFWTAKQLLRNKLGKKEDQHLTASDADFDNKLAVFYGVRDTSRSVLAYLEEMHHYVNSLSDYNRAMGVLLIKQSRSQKPHVAKAMDAVGHMHSYSAKQSANTLAALVRMYRELDLFNDRAVNDCATTVEAAEKARLEYRGSLMWVKKSSEELDPESHAQMEQFRTAQTVCRQNKEKLDQLKEDTFLKTDILTRSRTALLLETSSAYMTELEDYTDEMVRSYAAVLEDLQDIDSYEIDVLKILNDPMSLAVESSQLSRTEPAPIEEETDKTVQPVQTEPEQDLIGGLDGDSRPDSPLGELPDFSGSKPETPTTKTVKLEPLPILFDNEDQVIPKLDPPTGWVNRVKKGASELLRSDSEQENNFLPSSLMEKPSLNESKSDQKWDSWLDQFDPLKQTQQSNSSEA